MRVVVRFVRVSAILLLAFAAGGAKPAAAADDRSMVIVFKDGHRQSVSASEISRIDLKTPAAIIFKDGHHEKIAGEIDRIEFESGGMLPGKSHYIGKWEVGDGNGGKFFISLDADGEARKTTGSPHGTWAFVDGEAHISWDDGWHDAIRKVGTRHEKVAHEPGTSFDATPSNVTAAKNMDPKPI